jgi:phosphatidylserine/phosphatidylglycerophosphate/cardiolipin synthase-like enzyme
MRQTLLTSVFCLALVAGVAPAAAAADRLCDASYEDCRTPLLSLIHNEQIGIDVAFWFMEDARYTAALIDRWRQGVPVRVIMDTEANRNYPLNAEALQDLKAAGIPMLEKTSGGIVHWKTMIFAGQNVVEFSGANFSPHAFVPTTPYVNYIDEVIYFTDNPELVNSFKRRYDDVWTASSGYTAYANITAPRARVYPTFSIHPDLNFPPFNNFATRSVGRYNAETTAIDAIMFRITDRRHSDALIAARGRGVPVRLITEPGQYRDPVRLWHSWNVDRLYMAGVQVRVRAHESGENGMHQKTTLLRGQRMTIFGSSNWTSPSASSQLEHNIFTTDPYLYEFFSDVFDRKWNNRTGNVETKPFVPLPPDAPKYHAPANSSTGQSLSVTLKWNAGYFAHKYDIYFGTSSNPPLIAADVELGPSTTPTSYRSYAVSGLQESTTYYWKIVSKTMANRAASGPVWNFRTVGTAAAAGSGDVVLYAAKASVRTGRWSVLADATAAGGARIGTANAGIKLAAQANPADYFELSFRADAGVGYRLWLRGKAQSNSWGNDSAFVQFSDSVTSSGGATYRIGTTSATTVTIEDCTNCGLSGWGWNDNAYGAGALGPLIYFATTGDHRVRVQMREDGLSLDQIVLSRGAFLSAAPGATKDDGTILQEAGGTADGGTPVAASSLPSGWQGQDIGAVGRTGSASASGGTFTLRGAGEDVWGTADAFHYAYRTLAGDGTITARVASASGSEAWTKVGVMIRGSVSAGSAHAFMLVSTGKGLAFQRRTSNGGISTHTSGGTGTAPRWVRLTRAGATVTAFASTDGTTWTRVGSDTIALPSTALVGLAVSSHDSGVLATGVFDHVTVTSP